MAIECQASGCSRLVQAAIPFIFNAALPDYGFNAKKFCSMTCAKDDINTRITCREMDCKRLIWDAAPSSNLHSGKPQFNTRQFCSKNCYWAIEGDADEDHLSSDVTTTLITCIVCAYEKPEKAFIRGVTRYRTSPPVPLHCVQHIVPGYCRLNQGICIACIKSHILVQFRYRGPNHITCIHPHTDWDVRHSNNEWQLLALSFLPKKLHQEYYRRSFEAWWKSVDKWYCPNGCEVADLTLDPQHTPGYPEVECPECQDRSCARCRVPWHEGITCSQYVAAHPQFLSDEEQAVLREMAALHARRCPSCHWITVKEGGCSHMHCDQCDHEYDWSEAESVQSPRLSISDSWKDIWLKRQNHDLHYQHIGATATGDPHHDFLAYITYNPIAEGQTVDWQYLDDYEDGYNSDEVEKMRREACEMDAHGSAQLAATRPPK